MLSALIIAGVAGLLAGVGLFFGLVPRLAEAHLGHTGPPPAAASSGARELHGQSGVVDLHADTLLWRRDLLRAGRRGHVDLPRLQQGNVALQVFSAVTSMPLGARLRGTAPPGLDLISVLSVAQRRPPACWSSPLARALDQARHLRGEAARSGGGLVPILSRRDLARLLESRRQGSGAVGALLALEGCHGLGGAVDAVGALFAAGYRVLGLTHFFDNAVGGSAHGVGRGGLTALGRQVVARAEQLGMVLDLAHAAPALLHDVLAVATRPVLVSHTGLRATYDSDRNLDDHQLRAVAAAGGLIGVTFFKTAVGPGGLAAVVRAVHHAIDVVGSDHVALGSDFDGTPELLPVDAAGLVHLTAALLAHGLDAGAVRQVMGETALRFFLDALPEP